MRRVLVCLATICLFASQVAADDDPLSELKKRAELLKDAIQKTAEELMGQEFQQQDRARATGHSGVKHMRILGAGTKSYLGASHTDRLMVASIHNHPNGERMSGMGELDMILNGVPFRTRHNDYMIRSRHRSLKKFNKFEDIPFPEVPPSVTKQSSVIAQTAEMREWFKAWRDQDYSVRDYRKYFQPLMCYLEGAWTTNTRRIKEPFLSDRHHLDAATWLDMSEKVRFTSYSGTKDALENWAFMPTMVTGLHEDGTPILAQWNYAIYCHKLSSDLPLRRLEPVNDLQTRMARFILARGRDPAKASMEAHVASRSARFKLKSEPGDAGHYGSEQWTLLDDIMSGVPGKDGYLGNLTDHAFGSMAYPLLGDRDEPLNTAFYHRWYSTKNASRMGRTARHRSFSDDLLFMAQTTDPAVAPITMQKCHPGKPCETITQRWTFAIPLEIVYMTPLHMWNPYRVYYRGLHNRPEGKKVSAAGRNGKTAAKALNGVNTNFYYLTPKEFFKDSFTPDPADTGSKAKYVKDSTNAVREMLGSGFYIHYPEIAGVGSLRQRYPIMPIYGDGKAAWQELDALKEIALNPGAHKHMFREAVSTTCYGQCKSPLIRTKRLSGEHEGAKSTCLKKSGERCLLWEMCMKETDNVCDMWLAVDDHTKELLHVAEGHAFNPKSDVLPNKQVESECHEMHGGRCMAGRICGHVDECTTWKVTNDSRHGCAEESKGKCVAGTLCRGHTSNKCISWQIIQQDKKQKTCIKLENGECVTWITGQQLTPSNWKYIQAEATQMECSQMSDGKCVAWWVCVTRDQRFDSGCLAWKQIHMSQHTAEIAIETERDEIERAGHSASPLVHETTTEHGLQKNEISQSSTVSREMDDISSEKNVNTTTISSVAQAGASNYTEETTVNTKVASIASTGPFIKHNGTQPGKQISQAVVDVDDSPSTPAVDVPATTNSDIQPEAEPGTEPSMNVDTPIIQTDSRLADRTPGATVNITDPAIIVPNALIPALSDKTPNGTVGVVNPATLAAKEPAVAGGDAHAQSELGITHNVTAPIPAQGDQSSTLNANTGVKVLSTINTTAAGKADNVLGLSDVVGDSGKLSQQPKSAQIGNGVGLPITPDMLPSNPSVKTKHSRHHHVHHPHHTTKKPTPEGAMEILQAVENRKEAIDEQQQALDLARTKDAELMAKLNDSLKQNDPAVVQAAGLPRDGANAVATAGNPVDILHDIDSLGDKPEPQRHTGINPATKQHTPTSEDVLKLAELLAEADHKSAQEDSASEANASSAELAAQSTNENRVIPQDLQPVEFEDSQLGEAAEPDSLATGGDPAVPTLQRAAPANVVPVEGHTQEQLQIDNTGPHQEYPSQNVNTD